MLSRCADIRHFDAHLGGVLILDTWGCALDAGELIRVPASPASR